MRITVDHLTRMRPGYICVAGVDVSSGEHIRPALRGGLTVDLLARNGGPFDLADLVDLGMVEYCGHAPQTEDCSFDQRAARCLHRIPPGHFWGLLMHINKLNW